LACTRDREDSRRGINCSILFRLSPRRTVHASFQAHGSPVSSSLMRSALCITHTSRVFCCTACSPSPWSGRYPDPLSTMGTPSPWDSRPLGDPVFAFARRSVRVGSPVRSLAPFITGYSPQRAFRQRPFHWRIGGVVASGMLRRVLPFTVGNLGSTSLGFTMRTGLAAPHATSLRV
jgi:hypothetical protein